jgi:hypothetical protein
LTRLVLISERNHSLPQIHSASLSVQQVLSETVHLTVDFTALPPRPGSSRSKPIRPFSLPSQPQPPIQPPAPPSTNTPVASSIVTPRDEHEASQLASWLASSQPLLSSRRREARPAGPSNSARQIGGTKARGGGKHADYLEDARRAAVRKL